MAANASFKNVDKKNDFVKKHLSQKKKKMILN